MNWVRAGPRGVSGDQSSYAATEGWGDDAYEQHEPQKRDLVITSVHKDTRN